MSKLIEKRNLLLDAAEAIVQAAIDRGEAMTEEETKNHAELLKQADSLKGTIEAEQAMALRRTEMEAATRPAIVTVGGAQGEDQAKAEQRTNFLGHLKGTVPKAALTLSTKGDVLIPTTLYDQIIEGLKPMGGVRAARVTAHTGVVGTINIPVGNDTVKGRRLSTGAATPVDPTTLTSVPLTPYEYTSDTIVIDRSLLDGSPLRVEQYIAGLLRDRVWRITNEENTTGDGTGMPLGVLTAATVGFTGALVAGITWEELVATEHSVPSQFRTGAEWMFNDKTFMAIKTLKDDNGRPIFLDGNIVTGARPTILGYPFVINDDMPDLGSAKKPILFGDFSRVHVADGLNWSIRVLNELYAANNQVGFILFSMHGATFADAAGAVKSFKNATAV